MGTTALTLVFLALPSAAAFFALSLLMKATVRGRTTLPMRISLATGLGAGLFSCLCFIWYVLAGRPGWGMFIVETAFLAAAAALWRYRDAADSIVGPPGRDTAGPYLPAVFALVLLAASATFVVLTVKNPHGGIDATVIWNVRARFLFRSGQEWRDAFSPLLRSHGDYPPLLPMLVTGAWIFSGEESLFAPALIAFAFTFASVGLLSSTIYLLRGKTAAFLAGIVLAGTPGFAGEGALQQADIPLAFFVLAALSLCLVGEAVEGRGGTAFLTGAAAGLAAWTKNEGILFAAVISAALLAPAVKNSRKGERSLLIPYLAALSPFLAILLYFKTAIAPPGDLLDGMGGGAIIVRLTDPSRYLKVGGAFAGEALRFAGGAIPLLAACTALWGWKAERPCRQVLAREALVLVIVPLAYFSVYLLSPWDLDWHLRTSLHRLVFHLWPGGLLLLFTGLRAVDRPGQSETLPGGR